MKKIIIGMSILCSFCLTLSAQNFTEKLNLKDRLSLDDVMIDTASLAADTVKADIAYQEIKDIIQTIPSEIILGLEDSEKIILSSSDSARMSVENVWGGTIEREAFSKSYISLKTSKVGNTQIKLLPLINHTNILCVIKTVCNGICDSKVFFYTEEWEPIEGVQLFPSLTLDYFLKSGVDKQSQDFKNAISALGMYPIKIEMYPDNENISLTLNLKEYLSDDDYKLVKKYMNEKPKVLHWDKMSFK